MTSSIKTVKISPVIGKCVSKWKRIRKKECLNLCLLLSIKPNMLIPKDTLHKNIRINKYSPASSHNSMRLFIVLDFFLYNTNKNQRLTCLFYKRLNSEYFGHFRLQDLFSNYSALSSQHKIAMDDMEMNECLCSNKTLFTNKGI